MAKLCLFLPSRTTLFEHIVFQPYSNRINPNKWITFVVQLVLRCFRWSISFIKARTIYHIQFFAIESKSSRFIHCNRIQQVRQRKNGFGFTKPWMTRKKLWTATAEVNVFFAKRRFFTMGSKKSSHLLFFDFELSCVKAAIFPWVLKESSNIRTKRSFAHNSVADNEFPVHAVVLSPWNSTNLRRFS